jgi:hypothetical protein
LEGHPEGAPIITEARLRNDRRIRMRRERDEVHHIWRRWLSARQPGESAEKSEMLAADGGADGARTRN